MLRLFCAKPIHLHRSTPHHCHLHLSSQSLHFHMSSKKNSKKQQQQKTRTDNMSHPSSGEPLPAFDPRTDCVFVSPRGLVTIRVRVKPAARQSQLLHISEGELEMQIDAPAREGEANIGVCQYISRVLGVSKSSVALSAGYKSRNKMLTVEGMEAREVQRKIHDLLKQE